MKKFPITKMERELLAINERNGIENKSAVILIVNNMALYNTLLDEFKEGDTKKVYILYQLNGQIFKQLKEFKILPSSIKGMDEKEDDGGGVGVFLENLKNKIEKR